ncbi:MAG TPA: parallel beta-helix domain-containing protein [Balneolaceae bacterium]|nr:parallel beta-helix domain-containing protein [Balneolaceae bacterium]
MKSQKMIIFVVFSYLLMLSACKSHHDDGVITIEPGPNAQEETQDALNMAENGNVIQFEAGTFDFTRRLTMESKSHVTLQGRGRNNTILSFAGQADAGEAIFISNSNHIVVRDLEIENAKGDALKFKDSDSIVMFNIATTWDEPSPENGGYGLYPVTSSNILIDSCYSYGASDSGIYVGQSDKAIVRNSLVEGNVAGIEIENTTNADVYNNTATDNAAGILVFDLPDLSQYGKKARVFHNNVHDNIRGNFAPGGIVAEVPAGTGILVLSTKEVEVFDNSLDKNNVVGTAVASYQALVALDIENPVSDPNYDPFPNSVYIHDNSYSRSNTYPDAGKQSFFGNLLVNSFGSNPIPDIILDGIFAPDAGENGTVCIEQNDGSNFVNLNLPNDFPNNLSFDASVHACGMDPLPEVQVDVPYFSRGTL